MQDITITRNHIEEPSPFVELFKRLQAKYRSNGIHTPKEWPMDTPEGRESYRKSEERERFLAKLNGAKEVLARAEERLSVVPFGSKVNFESVMYGEVVQ